MYFSVSVGVQSCRFGLSVVRLRSFSLSSNLYLSGRKGYCVIVVFSMILFLSAPNSLNDHVILSVVLVLVLLHTCNIK